MTVNDILDSSIVQWMQRPEEKRTRSAFSRFVKTQIEKAGLMAISAPVNTGGTCQVCGEDSRCPGWHTPDDFRLFAQRLLN